MSQWRKKILNSGWMCWSLLTSHLALSQHLSGIIVGADPQLSRVIVSDDSSMSVSFLGERIGDSDPRVITLITPRYIELNGPQGKQRWYLGEQSSLARLSAARQAPQVVKREEASKPPTARILRFDQFVAVEWFARTGRGRGLKITSAVNPSWLTQSALRLNDVITEIDGALLSTPEIAQTSWLELAPKDLTTLVIRRGNQRLVLTVDLRLLL
ncbi:hypothetical protein DFR27_0249 [Umboniibacter marinipuniceus]|uniref:PDZ domain-containing protein n=1 Tax=Umboniibacter marinipuniceus TaxID=569599 RepID=A0A3M0AAX6_9GAMM|nr:hypothetical protein DFR27_0249 [Umboniibacter marinipuniceus]